MDPESMAIIAEDAITLRDAFGVSREDANRHLIAAGLDRAYFLGQRQGVVEAAAQAIEHGVDIHLHLDDVPDGPLDDYPSGDS